jgi:hypothetical protein
MSTLKFLISDVCLDNLKAKHFISATDVKNLFKKECHYLPPSIPDFKIARIYAKSKFCKTLREDGILSYNDKFCFIAISRTHTFLWHPFDKHLYILDKAPFEYVRHEKHFYKRASPESAPKIRFIIRQNQYLKDAEQTNYSGEKLGLIQENIILREYLALFNGIVLQTDILKVKQTYDNQIVSNKTLYFTALELDHRLPNCV